jgi:hypothetical protein
MVVRPTNHPPALSTHANHHVLYVPADTLYLSGWLDLTAGEWSAIPDKAHLSLRPVHSPSPC